MPRWLLAALLAAAAAPASAATHRLHDGVTAFVPNPDAKDFTVSLAVRDLNLFETGPRELLVKVYDPDGKAVVRAVVPDDGVTSKAFQPPLGAWDHEAWYYSYVYGKGTQPMLRHSAFSAPDRLASLKTRTFDYAIRNAKKGVYRVLVVGCIDHYVTLALSPDLPCAVAGHPDFLHGHGTQWARSFVHVPRGSVGLHAYFAEYDRPRQRSMTVRDPDGKVISGGKQGQIFWKEQVAFDKPGQYDDKILTVEVGKGDNDFLMGLKFRLPSDPEVTHRGERVVVAAFAPDAATARAAQNGAIYHDGRVFWQPFQVRLHDWLEARKPEDFDVRDDKGKPASPLPDPKSKLAPLPTREGFLSVNGRYWQPTRCDVIMHHYPAHKNKAALNVALRDLAAGLRMIGPNDHVSNATGGPFANLAYEFSNYAWHYWRPAWRVLRHSDAPDDVKAILREAFLVAGDRLSFCRTWERVNGNAFAQLLAALRYNHEATQDKMQKELFETYWQRFTTGGWGDRVGVGPSGPVQEGFAYAYHYASYVLDTWPAILADLKDDRFQRVYDRLRTWFSYTLADENVVAGPWSARTHHVPPLRPEKDGPFAWKGLPGPDFTDSVNGGDEWFAARRKGYYALTYHGRLSPKWESNAHPGQSGYGGGMLCQLHVPGKGPVIASTLNGSYGEGMDVSEWREFRLHTLAGVQADGSPFVCGDSEHEGVKLDKGRVVSSGDVRNAPLRCVRGFEFAADHVKCEVKLEATPDAELLELWLKNKFRGKVKEAYEMLPFVPKQRGKAAATAVTAVDKGGKETPLGKEAVEAAAVKIDRGGFGVRVEFDRPRLVMRGVNEVVMVRLADKVVEAKEVALTYRLVPYGN